MDFTLYDTMTRQKRRFDPIDPRNVRLYACGPTVYDFAHIGNARPAIVFDVLFRLLRHTYGPDHVTYVRNVTDVDDKINARAAAEGVSIRDLTERTLAQYHEDLDALGCLRPSEEPRATEFIPDMLAMIGQLVERGHAYVGEGEGAGHVLFDVSSMADYGALSNRRLDEMEAGARVEVSGYKRNPGDFVLWKPSLAGEPAWDSPYGPGRPGWHIECSAMSAKLLGETFDIHAGGLDLIFPHHENEIAQSRCAHGTEVMANYWLHNGYLQVEGRKMSKSEGNFTTIRDVLNGHSRRDVRLAMLKTHYRQPIDWTEKALREANANNYVLDRKIGGVVFGSAHVDEQCPTSARGSSAVGCLCDDLNTPAAIAALQAMPSSGPDVELPAIVFGLGVLGILPSRTQAAFDANDLPVGIRIDDFEREALAGDVDVPGIEALIASRTEARAAKDFARSDAIRDELAAIGVSIKDGPNGTTWELAR